jgi:sulfate adenylyltransferase
VETWGIDLSVTDVTFSNLEKRAAPMTDRLVAPHGGFLVDLLAPAERRLELLAGSGTWTSWDLTPRQICDLEMLADGSFSPLRGFLGQEDYESVCQTMRLADGTLWPMPITLDVPEALAAVGTTLALRDPEGVMLAALDITEAWRPDREQEAKEVFGTTDPTHPGVAQLLAAQPWYVSGRLEVTNLPAHHDYAPLRRSPAALRAHFEGLGWSRIVAFQTRNPMHRAHVELTLRAAEELEANLLIHPVVGLTKPGDVDHHTRVRCYQAVMTGYSPGQAELSLLPLAMRMGGPREAVWHAIIRKNHGVSHFIVGRDHAGPGKDAQGNDFYGPYDAQELLAEHTAELDIEMVPFRQMVYVPADDRYEPVDEVPAGTETLNISGTELRKRLAEGDEIPAWFTYPAVAEQLRRSYPARRDQGFTVFFTGLSGSGKSTVANALLTKLAEDGSRPITLLDGDLVRKHLSSELGFSKEHRDLNVRRIGWVASEITRNGGAVVCAPIAPYDDVRKEVRALVAPAGGFVLVHLATPLSVCESRDRKGLYAKARAGIVKEFTGISDPYEEPTDAELRIDTSSVTAEEAAGLIVSHLRTEGYLA